MDRSFTIRPGKTGDIPFLQQCIQELAEFERQPQAVEVSLAERQQHFGRGDFSFLVAEVAGTPAGMALYYPRYSTWKGPGIYLEDLMVRSRFRGRGLGKALLEAVAAEARRAGARRVDWQVLDWNSQAVAFYRRMGAEIETGWWNGKWYLPSPDSELGHQN